MPVHDLKLKRRSLSWRSGLAAFKVALGAAFLLLTLVLSSCSDQEKTSDGTPIISAPPKNTSLPMPPLNGKSLKDLGWSLGNGRRGNFSDYKGDVLVLDFYATYCEPCRESIPHLVQLQDRYQKEGLRVVGLNAGGPEDLVNVPAFAKEFNIQYTLGVGDDDLNNFLLGDDVYIPQTFVFDRKGLLKRKFVGFSDTTIPELDGVVQSALEATSN
jgi:thiol-disulfide isomerase/thioredoxin